MLTGCIATERVSVDNIFLFHKTTDSRLRDVMARQHPEAEIVILVNDEGNVAGSPVGNVFVEIDGEWVTPPRRCGNPVYAIARELVASGDASEYVVSARALEDASRIAVLDDTRGWRLVELKG